MAAKKGRDTRGSKAAAARKSGKTYPTPKPKKGKGGGGFG